MKEDAVFIGFVFTFVFLLGWPASAHGDYKDDIGYTLLEAALGGNMPNGDGVYVTQVEALSDDRWMPNTADSQFENKNIYDKSTGHLSGSSGHATSVGRYLYGTTSSVAPGIKDIDIYVAGYSEEPPWNWIKRGFLWHGAIIGTHSVQPVYDMPEFTIHCDTVDVASPSRVANHSWVGSSSSSGILRRLDFVVAADEFIQVVAMNNGSNNRTDLSSAFNVISVGRTDGNHPRGSVGIDSVYASGRTKPEIVAPMTVTSLATPVVAASAALLVQTGRKLVSSDGATTNRDGEVISNAECSEVIKAALMAGADRFTQNTSTSANITDYRNDANDRADNGLDKRFGAGQLNIYNSYYVIASGEQNSNRTGSGNVDWRGFDVDPAFGVSGGTADSASYFFTSDETHCRLAASLVWNLKIDGGACDNFNNAATLYDFNLRLYDITGGERQLIVSSPKSNENTENLWIALQRDRNYEMEVVAVDQGDDFVWDYALAWQVIADGDKDSLADYWELEHHLSPENPSDADLDTDGDNLSNLEEFESQTSPNDPDTDHDLIRDGDELLYWLSLDCSGFGCDDCLNCDIDGDGQVNNLLDDDADGDGVGDASDNCPTDPAKTDPGTCGCGIADQDTDQDGTFDCNDGCPTDSNKTVPGLCNCGVPDNDTDGDGMVDCLDSCPNDANKTLPGFCGCNIADTDSDGDGSLNCVDDCPDDGEKTQPGACDCGVPDTDSDNDGIADCVENDGPNGGDTNDDSIPDSQQENVVAFKALDEITYVTLESPTGTIITNCQDVDNPSPIDAPSDIDFPFGFFQFTINGVLPDAAVSVVLILHGGITPDTYYKYGPTPDNHSNHWYEFMYNDVTGTEIKGNEMTLHFVNGDRGDDDLDANNSLIIDVGGPGIAVMESGGTVTSATSTDGGGGGGGGCFINTAASCLGW